MTVCPSDGGLPPFGRCRKLRHCARFVVTHPVFAALLASGGGIMTDEPPGSVYAFGIRRRSAA